MKAITRIAAALTMLLCASSAFASEAWHVVLATGEKISVSEIECMVMAPGTNTYDIILNHDNIVYADVVRITFEYCEETGAQFAQRDGEKVLGPYEGTMVVKGAKLGSEIRIFSSTGQCVASATVQDSEPCTIDISTLPAGIYVLSTPNSRVKFAIR